jgi:4'-phosphopantetheinyl transferase EntD
MKSNSKKLARVKTQNELHDYRDARPYSVRSGALAPLYADADSKLLTSLIRSLYAVPVSVVVANPDMEGEAWLEEEIDALGPAVPNRMQEFAWGRACARAALAPLLGAAPPILRKGRAPAWPLGIVGSISHSAGICASVVANSEIVSAVGLDLESKAPLSSDFLSSVCRPEEIAAIQRASLMTTPRWAKAIFSAKEAIYKCYSPVFDTFLDFQDVRLTMTDNGFGAGVVRAELANPSKPGADFIRGLQGRWIDASGLILAGAWC